MKRQILTWKKGKVSKDLVKYGYENNFVFGSLK